ncbi:MAG: histidine phosphatase family protein, partial [Sneathiella sp.]
NEEDPELCVALREQHFGDWQGRTFDEAKEADPDVYQHFWQDPAMHAPPNGESFDDVVGRVTKTRKEISSRNVEENILVVAHAGTIRAILADALGISSEKALLFNVDPLSLTKLTLYSEKSRENWQINWINRTY